jgi:hypothetical protein
MAGDQRGTERATARFVRLGQDLRERLTRLSDMKLPPAERIGLEREVARIEAEREALRTTPARNTKGGAAVSRGAHSRSEHG